MPDLIDIYAGTERQKVVAKTLRRAANTAPLATDRQFVAAARDILDALDEHDYETTVASGYERAIADLRAEAARTEERTRGTTAVGFDAYDFAADWLESKGTES